MYALLVNSQPLEKVYCYKYLGILLTSDLSWSAHISKLCSKARQQIGKLYHKVYRYSDVYVAFIRPNPEYTSAVWDPHLSQDIQNLNLRWNDAYSDTLHTLNVPPLSERRKHLKCVISTRLSTVSLTSQMHLQCTNLAQITSPDTHILSPFYNPRLAQTLLFLLFFTCCSGSQYFAILCCVI